jgi:hypothetical protein
MASNGMSCPEFAPSIRKDVARSDIGLPACEPTTTLRDQPIEVLAELGVLLEEYAPLWYAEDLRHRILTALRVPTAVLVEVCALLEDHAPSWYTDRQRGRALGTLRALGILGHCVKNEAPLPRASRTSNAVDSPRGNGSQQLQRRPGARCLSGRLNLLNP